MSVWSALRWLALFAILWGGAPFAAEPVAPPPDVASVVAGEFDLGLDLCDRLVPTDGNVVLAPHAVASGLGMLYAGARGRTETDMARTLHFELPQERLHPAFGLIEDSVRSMGARGRVEIELARAMWVQTEEPPRIRQEYLSLAERYYHPDIKAADFWKRKEAVWPEIDRWVAEHTRDRLTAVYSTEPPPEPPTIVQVTVAYLDARWARPFHTEPESGASFFVRPDSLVTVPMMSQARDLPYHANRLVQMVELPYKEEQLSMLILLPRERYGLSSVESVLSGQRLSAWVDSLAARRVWVSMPRFTIGNRLELAPALTSMGMGCAFDRGCADFSGILPAMWYDIMRVAHDAWVRVDEEGTEAAAAVVLDVDAPPELPPPATEFFVDHPFMFVVRDRATGGVLFLGRVADPSILSMARTRSN